VLLDFQLILFGKCVEQASILQPAGLVVMCAEFGKLGNGIRNALAFQRATLCCADRKLADV
jgi:hypothetical protein